MNRAEIIDSYFRQKDYYSWIPYQPIGADMVAEIERQGDEGLYLSTAAALVEQESGGKNLFGCDWGTTWVDVPPFCQVKVTKDRVKKLIANVEAGGGQNGVGLTQLTTISYVYEAEKMGGAHIPRYQMRVGFRVLLEHIFSFGWPAGAAAYNAGAGNWRSVINTYGASMARLQAEWAERLSAAGEEVDPAVPVKPYVVIYTKTEKQAERIARNWQRRGLETETGKGDDGEGRGDIINLSKYKPTNVYGLTPHADRVRQAVVEHCGPFPQMDSRWHGYRTGDTTEHNTRRAIDFFSDSKQQLDQTVEFLLKHSTRDGGGLFKVGGIIYGGRQTGYSEWLGDWVRQRWEPPAGWQRDGDFGISDPYHRKHVHVMVNE